MDPFQAERVLPPVLAYLFIYIYIYGSTRMMDMPVCTSYVLNTHALLSALFRQKDSCHPFWRIKYIYINKSIYIYIYTYGSKRIMEMRICTSYVLNKQTHCYRLLFGRKIFATHTGVYFIYIYFFLVPKELWKCQYVLVMY